MVALLLGAGLLGLSDSARADEAPATVAPAEAPVDAVSPAAAEAASPDAPTASVEAPAVAGSAATEAAAPRAEAASVQAGPASPGRRELEDEGAYPRFRGGFMLLQFGGLFGEIAGVSMGFSGHAGAQLSKLLAVYWQPSISGGIGFDTADDPDALFEEGTEPYGSFHNAAIAELTLGDVLHVGAGPGFELASYQYCTGPRCQRDEGVFPSVVGRLAVTLPLLNRETRRAGLTLALTSRTSFVGDRYYSMLMLGAGATFY